MSFKIKQAVQAYFETCVSFNIMEKDVKRFIKGNNIILVETDKKTYFRTIDKKL